MVMQWYTDIKGNMAVAFPALTGLLGGITFNHVMTVVGIAFTAASYLENRRHKRKMEEIAERKLEREPSNV